LTEDTVQAYGDFTVAIFDPLEYGAKFDGVHDDRPGMAACVKAAVEHITSTGAGAVVQMPSGIALFGSHAEESELPSSWKSEGTTCGVPIPAELPASLVVRGEGRYGVTTIKLTDACPCNPFFPVAGAHQVVANLVFEDFHVDLGNVATQVHGSAVFGNENNNANKLLRLSYEKIMGRRLSISNAHESEENQMDAFHLQGKHLAANEATQTFTKKVYFDQIDLGNLPSGLRVNSAVGLATNHFYDDVGYSNILGEEPLHPHFREQTKLYICGSGFGNYCFMKNIHCAGVGDDMVEIGAMQYIDIDDYHAKDPWVTGITFRLTHPLLDPTKQVIAISNYVCEASSALTKIAKERVEEKSEQVPACRPINFLIDAEGGTFGTLLLRNCQHIVDAANYKGLGSEPFALSWNFNTKARVVRCENVGTVIKDYVFDQKAEKKMFGIRTSLGTDTEGTYTPRFEASRLSVSVLGWSDSGSEAGKCNFFPLSATGKGRVDVERLDVELLRNVSAGGGLAMRYARVADEEPETDYVALRRMVGSQSGNTGTGSRGGVSIGNFFAACLLEENDWKAWRSSTAIKDVTFTEAGHAKNVVERDNRSAFDSGYRGGVEGNYEMTYLTTTVGVSSTTAEREIILPELGSIRSPGPGNRPIVYSVVDESNHAGTKKIIVKCAGTDTFADGTTSKVISVNGGQLAMYASGQEPRKWIPVSAL
jgi:hypothetical protein